MSSFRVEVSRHGEGHGWVVRAGPGSVIASTRTKPEAVEIARSHLSGLPGGGTLAIYLADGQLQKESIVGPTTIRAEGPPVLVPHPPSLSGTDRVVSPGLSDAGHLISKEGKKIDKGLDLVDWLVTVLALVGVPTGAWFNPAIQEAGGKGWIALTFATFTWTIGCALAYIVLKRSGLNGYPLIAAVTACYVVSSVVAIIIGQGILNPEKVSVFGPINLLLGFAQAALSAYGGLGLLLSTAVGTWLGVRLAPHVPDAFMD